MDLKYDFNDVLIQASIQSEITNRSEINPYDKNGFLPLITAPMDTVINEANQKIFYNKKIKPCLPRHEFANLDSFESYGLSKFNNLLDRKTLSPTGHYLIDIANGHMMNLVETTQKAKELYPDITLMVGNVAHPETYKILSEAGADLIRVGIGNGCFGRGSRVLMSNGFYKNIEDICVGDYVINMHGNPVKVKRVINNGLREVLSVKTSMSPKETMVTNNHEYYVGNYNKKIKDSKGYKKSITSNSWRFINDYDNNLTPLFPKKIKFNFAKDFDIDLCDYSINKKHCENYKTLLKPNYNLGYVFGTYLGDGNSSIRVNQLDGVNGPKKSTSGSIHWSFGVAEIDIANKLKNIIKELFGLDVKTEKTHNMIRVHLYNKPFAHFLYEFGKRENKHLPENLLVDNIEYLTGIYDGLIDSDGNHGNKNDKRKSFHNTSIFLVELFNIINYKINGELPNSNNRGDINNSKLIENSKKLFTSRLMLEGSRRITKCNNFIINKIVKHENTGEVAEVYDLEVDCDTHSFILDNCIVHNSGCLTTQNTGVGYPMGSLIRECYEMSCTLNNPAKIIADGGMKSYSDINKALALGADYVMLGSILNKSLESAGDNYLWKKIKVSQKLAERLHKLGLPIYKKFRGMSTKEVQKKWGAIKLRTSEGVVRYRKVEYTIDKWVENFQDYLTTAMSYCGAKNLDEFIGQAKYNLITNNAYKRFNK